MVVEFQGKSEAKAVLGRQLGATTPWLTERHGYDPTFMDYYSPFWGHKAISMVVEFQGALTCRSSTIIVWADSGPFHGLLLPVLGSRSGFHA